MVVHGGGWRWVVVGGPWRPLEALEATESSSRAQILAQLTKSSPLTTPPGPLKLRWFREYWHAHGSDAFIEDKM